MKEINKQKIAYVCRKFLQMIVVLVLLSIVVFVIARLCPGDPLRAYYGDGVEHMSEMEKDAARENLGLNDSIVVQYGRWAQHLAQGDLGLSFKYKQPVSQVIAGVWINTLVLCGLSYVLTFYLAIALGKFCAFREDSRIDRLICKVGTVSTSIPSFFMALLLILIFSVNLGILPAGGAYSLGEKNDVLGRIYHLILPVSVLVLEHLWYYAYMVRNKLLEETRRDYVLLCKAEGIPAGVILGKHCMRNIMPSMLTVMAISAPHILGGAYVVEMVFSYPGLGTLSFEAAMYQDYNMLMALCLITGAVVLVFNLAAQILSMLIDPRTRYAEEITGEEGVG